MNTLIPDQTTTVLENIVFLKNTTLFSAMPSGDLRAVASIADDLTFPAGAQIVRERDVGDSLYLIKQGTIRISKKSTEGGSIDLATLSIGECFGEMAVFDAELRSATATAQTDCRVLRIGGDDLVDVIMDCPSIALQMLKIFVKRLRAANTTIEKLSVAPGTRASANYGREG